MGDSNNAKGIVRIKALNKSEQRKLDHKTKKSGTKDYKAENDIITFSYGSFPFLDESKNETEKYSRGNKKHVERDQKKNRDMRDNFNPRNNIVSLDYGVMEIIPEDNKGNTNK